MIKLKKRVNRTTVKEVYSQHEDSCSIANNCNNYQYDSVDIVNYFFDL